MRVQHWITPALGLMLALANGRDASAQYLEDPYGSPGSASASVHPAAHAIGHYDNGLPPAYDQPWVGADAYGGYPPAYTPVAAYPFDGGNGYGPSVQPWPMISPYDHAFSEHTNQGGLWQQATAGFGKKWYFRSEYLSTRTKKPEGIVGDTSTQSYFSQVFPDEFSLIPGQGGGGDDGGDGEGGSDNASLADVNFYNRHDLHSMRDIFGDGGRFSGGFWNEDGSGWGLGFWFTGDHDEVFDARDHNTRVQYELRELIEIINLPTGQFGIVTNIGQAEVFDILEANLLNLRGLPVNDGTEAGIVIPYDIYFQVTTRSQSLGANVSHYWTPFFQRRNIKVRPVAGARYLMIDEGFNFVGVDSGLLYGGDGETPTRDLKMQSVLNGIDDDDDGIVDNAGYNEGLGNEGGDDGGGGGGGGDTETVLFARAGNNPFNLTKSFVDVDTLSHLVGPEFGLSYDLGGDKFRLSGETKFGLMVNNERIELRGDNIGSITRSAFEGVEVVLPGEETEDGGGGGEGEEEDDTFIENDPGLLPPTAENPHPNAFADRESHTHFSPLFEQSIFADINIFGYVPVLKDIHILEEAKFRFGYTFIWANEIVTTNQSVVWDGKPTAGLFPHIKLKRETWWTSNYSFGVSWDF